MEIYGTNPMNIYVSRNATSDPTEFSYDMSFKETMFVKLDSSLFDILNDPSGYAVTVYTEAYDQPDNAYLSAQVLVQYQETAADATDIQQVQDTVNTIMDTTYDIVNSDRPIKSLLDLIFA